MFIINYCLNMFRASPCYCIWCTALVLLDVVGSGCGALRCRIRALCYCIWCTALVLLDVVGSGCGALPQRPTTATNHIQQNQSSTPYAVTWSLFS